MMQMPNASAEPSRPMIVSKDGTTMAKRTMTTRTTARMRALVRARADREAPIRGFVAFRPNRPSIIT